MPWPPNTKDKPPYIGLSSVENGWQVDADERLLVRISKTRGYCLIAKDALPSGLAFAPVNLSDLKKLKTEPDADTAAPFSTDLLDACYGV